MLDKLQPVQSSLVRVIAQDAPALNFGSGATPSSKAPQVQDTANARLQDATNSTNKAYDIQRSNLDSQAQTYAEQAKAVGKPQWIQDFADISDTLMKGANIYKQQEAAAKQAEAEHMAAVQRAAKDESDRNAAMQVEVAKKNAETQKRMQDDYYSVASGVVNNKLLDLSRIVRENGESTGVLTVKKEVDEYLASQKNNLSPDAYRALQDKVYNELGKVDNTQTARMYEQQKGLKNSLEEQALAQYKGRATGTFVQISNASSPEEIDASMKSFNAVLEAVQKDTSLNSQQKMDIQTKLYNQMSELTFKNATTQAAVTKARDANQEYSTSFQQLNQLRDEGTIDENQYRAALNDIQIAASSKGVPGLTTSPLLTKDQLDKLGLDMLQTANGLQEAAEKAGNRQAAEDAKGLSKAAVGNTVFQLIQNPHLIANIDKAAQPELFQAAELKKQFDKDVTIVQGLQSENVKMQLELAAAARKLDPSRKGVQSVYNPNTGRFEGVDGFPPATISKEEYDALVAKKAFLGQQIAQKASEWQTGYGLNVLVPTDASMLQSKDSIQTKTTGISTATGLVPTARNQPKTDPFSRATSQGKPAARPVADLAVTNYSGKKLTTPFGAKDQSIADTVSSEYGMRIHPVTGGSKFHSGIDFAAPEGTPIRTINGGVVQDVYTGGAGFGYVVAVKTPSGHVEFFAHNSAILVKKGDSVAPGQVVSRSGATGVGTGAHLHFTVVLPGKWNDNHLFNESNTMNPVEYMAQARSLSKLTLGSGVSFQANAGNQSGGILTSGRLPPGMSPLVVNALRRAGIDPNNITLKPKEYTADPYTGVAVETSAVTGGRKNSYTNKGVSISRRDYPTKNDPNESYGYKELENDKPFLREVAAVADRLGMPAVWLLDVMRFESFNSRTGKAFDPSVVNQIGATGLIQFMPETAQGLGTSTDALSRMSRVQQMKYVEKYFNEIKGKIKSPGDTLAFIFGGYGLFSKPESRRNSIGDGQMTYGNYKKKLGEFVGRSYNW